MRTLRPVIAVLALVLVPPVCAEDLPPTVVATDPAGDAAGPLDPAGRGAVLDLLAMEVAEGPAEFTVRLAVAGLGAPQAPLVDSVAYRAYFAYGGVAYQVRMVRGASLAGPVQGTLLWDPSGGQAFEPLQAVDAFADPAARILSASVPRTALVDRAGAPTFAGQPLSGFWASTETLAGSAAGLPGPGDRAPDSGLSEVAVPVRFGLRQEGHARLSSPEPFRASNGEAATFRYRVVAENLRDGPDRFQLAADRVPPGWAIRLPDGDVPLDGRARTELEVFAEVPFAHSHGRLATFELRLASLTDEMAEGRLLLGILYTQPAQPAGHHETLTLHSRAGLGMARTIALALGSAGGGVEAYMNTLADDPSDEGHDVPPTYEGPVMLDTVSRYTWMVPLSPTLGLGLDFDLRRTGEARIPFVAPGPLPGAVLSGSVRLLGNGTPEPGAGAALAEIAGAAAVDVGPAQATVLVATIRPLPEGDYVPQRAGQNLWLELALTFARPDPATGPATPLLRPGGTVTLPLLEYSDTGPGGRAPTDAEAEAAAAAAPPTRDMPSEDVAAGAGAGVGRSTPGLGVAFALLGLTATARMRRR